MRGSLIRVAKGIARRIIGRPILGRSILLYHRIAKADFDPWNIAVSPDEFDRQLAKLRSKTVLPLQEFEDFIPNKGCRETRSRSHSTTAMRAMLSWRHRCSKRSAIQQRFSLFQTS